MRALFFAAFLPDRDDWVHDPVCGGNRGLRLRRAGCARDEIEKPFAMRPDSPPLDAIGCTIESTCASRWWVRRVRLLGMKVKQRQRIGICAVVYLQPPDLTSSGAGPKRSVQRAASAAVSRLSSRLEIAARYVSSRDETSRQSCAQLFAEQFDHVLPGAQHQAGALYVGLSNQRGFSDRLAIQVCNQLANHSTLGHRRLQFRLELRRGLHLLTARYGHRPRRRQDCGNRVGFAEVDLGSRDHRIWLNRSGLLEVAEAPPEQLARLVGTRLCAAGVEDHRDEAHAVAFGRSDKTVAGFLGVTRLQSIDCGICVQQGVAVSLLDVVVLELTFCVERIEVGAIADDGARQDRKIAGRRLVPWIG